MELQHGCREEYGPLELRIQTTDSLNGFTVYVELCQKLLGSESRRIPRQPSGSCLAPRRLALLMRVAGFERLEHNVPGILSRSK